MGQGLTNENIAVIEQDLRDRSCYMATHDRYPNKTRSFDTTFYGRNWIQAIARRNLYYTLSISLKICVSCRCTLVMLSANVVCMMQPFWSQCLHWAVVSCTLGELSCIFQSSCIPSDTLCFYHLFADTNDPALSYVAGPYCGYLAVFCCSMSCSLSVGMDRSFFDKLKSLIMVELGDTYYNTVCLCLCLYLTACSVRVFLDPGTLQMDFNNEHVSPCPYVPLLSIH